MTRSAALRHGRYRHRDPRGAERQLIRVELLGAAPKLRALQLLDDEPKLLDLAVAPLHVSDDIAHQALQQSGIVGKGIEIEMHEKSLRRSSDSINRSPS